MKKTKSYIIALRVTILCECGRHAVRCHDGVLCLELMVAGCDFLIDVNAPNDFVGLAILTPLPSAYSLPQDTTAQCKPCNISPEGRPSVLYDELCR